MAMVSRLFGADRRAEDRGKKQKPPSPVVRIPLIDGLGSEGWLDVSDPCPRCRGLLFEERIPFQLHYEYSCYNCGNRILGPYSESPDLLRPLPPEEQPGAYHQNNSRGKSKGSGSRGGKRAAEIAKRRKLSAEIKKARKSVLAGLGLARSRRRT